MDPQLFIWLVAILAVIYAAVAKLIQNKFIDKKRMEEYQAKMKSLNEEYKKAQQSGDSKKMQTALDKQLAYMPEMNKIMFAQFKPMIFIIAVFAIFSWVIGALDENHLDDFTLNLSDNGLDCDIVAGDGTYSGCYQLINDNGGKWTITAMAYEAGRDVGQNQSYFHYGTVDDDEYSEPPKGETVIIETDKKDYGKGEIVSIYATPAKMTNPGLFSPAREMKVETVTATLSNGTYFRADLPITIPILNWNAFYQPIVWFIFISFVLNLLIGFAMNLVKKVGK
jgi:uncharacterized membrane protein (DUF106 family)